MEKRGMDRRQMLQSVRYLIQGILATTAICIVYGVQTSGILSFLILSMYLFLIFKYNPSLEKKEGMVKVLLSGLFSVLTVLGEFLVISASEYTSSWVLTATLCLLGFYVIYELIIGVLLSLCRINYLYDTDGTQRNQKQIRLFAEIAFGMLFAVWFVGWLRTYPGSLSRDSIQIAKMALEEVNMYAAVPIVYILPIRLFWNMGEALFGTPNAGLALCTFMQMLMCAGIVTYAVTRLYANHIKRWVCVVVLLYYALMPYNTYMVTTIWKDVPFAVSTLLFMSLLLDFYENTGAKKQVNEYIRLGLFVIAGMGICLMRNNGLFAFLLFIPFGLFVFWKKNKKMVLAILLIIVCTRVVQGPVYDKIMSHQAEVVAQKNTDKKDAGDETKKVNKVKNATDSYNGSAIYIIPLQQLANVAVDRTDLSAEDYARLDRAIKVEEIRKNYAEKSDYCRRCIDMNANLVRFGTPKSEYIGTWIYFGLKYPLNYIIGWRGQTLGYWYPDIQNWTTIDAIIENDMGLYKEWMFTEELSWKLTDLEELYMKIPGYGLLWSIGFVVWISIFFMGVAYIRKGWKAAMLYIPLGGIWLTLLIAAPIYAEFRYMYSLFLCLPLAVVFPFMGKKEEMTDEK